MESLPSLSQSAKFGTGSDVIPIYPRKTWSSSIEQKVGHSPFPFNLLANSVPQKGSNFKDLQPQFVPEFYGAFSKRHGPSPLFLSTFLLFRIPPTNLGAHLSGTFYAYLLKFIPLQEFSRVGLHIFLFFYDKKTTFTWNREAVGYILGRKFSK